MKHPLLVSVYSSSLCVNTDGSSSLEFWVVNWGKEPYNVLPLNPLYIFKTQKFSMFESLTSIPIQNAMIEVYSSGEKEVREKV